MTLIKKFFEPVASEFGGAYDGNIADLVEQEKQKEKEDQVKDEKPAENNDTPPTNEEVVEEPKAEVEEPKEDVAEEVAEEAVEEPKEEPKEIKFNLDEEIKKIDKYEAMKKLGFDDFEIDLLKYKEQTGDLTPYLEAKTVDYSKFTDEQMMRHDLHKQYKDMPDKLFEQLYEQRVNDHYKLDAEIHGDAAAELGRELMKHDALKIRKDLIDNQAKFKAPEKPVDDTAQRQQQEMETKLNEYKEYVNESDNTKSLLKSKRLVFGSGDQKFNYTVEPKTLVDAALNPNLIFNDLVDKKGNVDLVKFYKAKAYVANMDDIEKKLINYGKTLGEKKNFEGLENTSKKEAPVKPTSNEDMTDAQLLAKYGQVSSGN